MAAPKIYALEVRDDFINKETHAQPVPALAELIWNSLDADATLVEVKEDKHELGQSRIIIADNGQGFSHSEAPKLFSQLGGSWKHLAGQSKGNRFLHGAEGKGRLKAFALGRVVDWEVCYLDGKDFKRFTISMLENSLREVRITEPEISPVKRTGVRCVISELRKEYEFLQSPNLQQELSEVFAIYLKNYNDVQINLPTGKLNISVAIAASKTVVLESITEDGIEYPVELELIEWKSLTGRALFLCNEAGLPLSQTDIRIQAPGLNFSAYLKSQYVSKLSREGTLGLGELNAALAVSIANVKDAVKAFHRERTASKSKTVVEKWKEESVYPFKSEPISQVERIEREIFDIVAVKVSNLVPEFDIAPQKGKKLQLRMLRQAIEQSPEDLQLILTEVLDLTDKRQKEFAGLLKETSLTAIISASKVVSDRLKFLSGLQTLLFDTEEKKHLKERTQLHRLLAENTWIFGEEFSLSVDDQSLTEVLRKHLLAQKLSVVVDDPVLRIDGSVGIVDLMLTRNIPSHREDELDHLVIELKRPTVRIGSAEVTQIKSYAFAVAEDERFRGLKTRWTFWIISNDMDAFGKNESNQANRPAGLIYQSEDRQITIWAKTWSEVLHSNRQRLRLFQSCLEINADNDRSLQFLKDTYASVLGSVEESEEVVTAEVSAALAVNEQVV
jgi:gas vesicle protein